MTIEELAHAYIAEKTLEGIRDYMVRGRCFANLTEEALNAQWVEAYRAACTLEDEKSWGELLDLQCEFDLRGIKPPMDLLAAEADLFTESFERLMSESPPDPKAVEEAEAEIAALCERLRRPKN
jgi:hypothetical protein